MPRTAAGQGMRRACARLAVLEVAELIVDGVGGLEPVVRVSLAIVDALHPVLVVGVHLAIGRLLAGHRIGGDVGGGERLAPSRVDCKLRGDNTRKGR